MPGVFLKWGILHWMVYSFIIEHHIKMDDSGVSPISLQPAPSAAALLVPVLRGHGAGHEPLRP